MEGMNEWCKCKSRIERGVLFSLNLPSSHFLQGAETDAVAGIIMNSGV